MTPIQKLIKFLNPVFIPIVKLYWKLFKPKTYGVKVVVEGPDNKILVVRHSYLSGVRTFPGGGLKRSEDIISAGIRETKEELDIDLEKADIIGDFVTTTYGKIDTVYVIKAKTNSSVVNHSPFEIKDYSWEKASEVKNLGAVGQQILDIYLSSTQNERRFSSEALF